MADVIAALTMSLDGFIAHEDDSVGHLFDWYEIGDVALSWPGMGMVSPVGPRSDVVDEIAVELAPVLLGTGIRFFGELANPPMLLDDPEVIEGSRVTHLRYRVRHRPR